MGIYSHTYGSKTRCLAMEEHRPPEAQASWYTDICKYIYIYIYIYIPYWPQNRLPIDSLRVLGLTLTYWTWSRVIW